MDRKEWRAALDAFTAVQNPPAKICFNIGCIHLVLGQLAEAEEVRYSLLQQSLLLTGTSEFAHRPDSQMAAVGKEELRATVRLREGFRAFKTGVKGDTPGLVLLNLFSRRSSRRGAWLAACPTVSLRGDYRGTKLLSRL